MTHIQNDFNFNFFTSKDNKLIRWGYMRVKNGISDSKGVILLLNGRTEFMEKYTQVASHLSCMGYHVMSLDWRGQGLSVRELPNRDKGYVKDFNLYIKDLEFFYNLHVLPLSKYLKLPITILAHSMGGHIALRFLFERSNFDNLSHVSNNIKKAILISPMIDIITSPIQGYFANRVADLLSRNIANLSVKFGLESRYIAGGKDYHKKDAKFEGNVLTHDWENFWLEHKEISKNRNLALGGVTWGWLKAAFDSIDILKDKKYLSSIKTPITIVSAEQDSVVSNSSQKQACHDLFDGKFISIPNARHEILFETEEIRELLWSYISLEL